MWAGRFKRRPDEAAKSETIPPELECFAGSCGPFIKTDRAEFHHADTEAQRWFLRLEPEDVADIRGAVKSRRFWRSVRKWANRTVWSAIASFSAVALAGERFAKLPETISGVLSAGLVLWEALRGRLGL